MRASSFLRSILRTHLQGLSERFVTNAREGLKETIATLSDGFRRQQDSRVMEIRLKLNEIAYTSARCVLEEVMHGILRATRSRLTIFDRTWTIPVHRPLLGWMTVQTQEFGLLYAST